MKWISPLKFICLKLLSIENKLLIIEERLMPLNDVEQLTQDIATEVVKLIADVTALPNADDIAALKLQVKNLTDQITVEEADKAALQEQINTLNSGLDGLAASLGTVKSGLQTIDDKLPDAQSTNSGSTSGTTGDTPPVTPLDNSGLGGTPATTEGETNPPSTDE